MELASPGGGPVWLLLQVLQFQFPGLLAGRQPPPAQSQCTVEVLLSQAGTSYSPVYSPLSYFCEAGGVSSRPFGLGGPDLRRPFPLGDPTAAFWRDFGFQAFRPLLPRPDHAFSLDLC